ncbi:hypothetical protein [Pseudomonas sp. efr-133-TYG-103a]|uniref:hypothetical protein n=1 Tax=Pseudomonas sp. efr-133-TYG-103a TaxID=3040308 RepID=UPI00255426E8|nr:hypothetical protein [Pseudomonas sp. efr-133-TYG-103a]
MWKRKRRESLAQDLYDTADDLLLLARQLMEVSVTLKDAGDSSGALLTTRMVLTLQDREISLRSHADRMVNTGNLGRRATDRIPPSPPAKGSDADTGA